MWQAATTGELRSALAASRSKHAEQVCLIEIMTEARDCSLDLLNFGGRLGAYTSRPPKPV
jgi:hypothetical protein